MRARAASLGLRAVVQPRRSGAPPTMLATGSWSIQTPQRRIDKTVDVLLASYPKLFSETPDLSIYRDDIEFHGLLPSGDSGLIRGIDGYRRLFEALRIARQTTVADADLAFNLSVSECESEVSVRWHAKLWLRLMGQSVDPIRVDGISVYQCDDEGMVRTHRLENVHRLGDRRQAVYTSWLVPPVAVQPSLAFSSQGLR